MKNIPVTIIYLLTIIPFTFIVEEIAYLYRFEWNATEVYIDDPVYFGITLLWLGIILWVSTDIIRRKKHIPNTIQILFIITLLFYIFDITEYNYTLYELIIYSFGPFLWLTAYVVSKNKVCSEWFVK